MRTAQFGRATALIALLALVVAGCGGDTTEDEDGVGASPAETSVPTEEDSPEEAHELDFASFLGEGVSISQAALWLLDEIERETEGAVTFELFMSNSLLGADEIMEGVGDRRSSLGHWSTVYHTGEFPLADVVNLPLVTNNVPAQVQAMNELYQTNSDLREEFESRNQHVLTFISNPPSTVGTNIPLETIDDLSGLDIRSSGFINQALEAVGANAIVIPSPETYESVQRGVIDGFAGIILDFVVGLSLHEVVSHVTDTGLGLFGGTLVTVNLDQWNELSADLQEEIQTIVDDQFAAQLVSTYEEHEEQSCQVLLDEGIVLSAFSDSEVERWRELLGDSVFDAWKEDVEATGVDADAYYQEYLDLLRQYEQEWEDYEPGIGDCVRRYEAEE